MKNHPGKPMGSDVVPAWLTPGEFVMNAEAAKMYAPQIQAMNDHGRAIQAAQGGTIPKGADVPIPTIPNPSANYGEGGGVSFALSPEEIEKMKIIALGEARGEDELGQAAVLWTMLNRGERFNKKQTEWKVADFETLKNEKSLSDYKKEDIDKVSSILDNILEGKVKDPTGGATHYYANKGPNKVEKIPDWADPSEQDNEIMRYDGLGDGIQIGNHFFTGDIGKDYDPSVSLKPPSTAMVLGVADEGGIPDDFLDLVNAIRDDTVPRIKPIDEEDEMNNNFSKGGKVNYLGSGGWTEWLTDTFGDLFLNNEDDEIPYPETDRSQYDPRYLLQPPPEEITSEIEEDKPIVTKNYNYAPAGAFIGGGQFPPELTEQGGSDYQIPKDYGNDIATPGIAEAIMGTGSGAAFSGSGATVDDIMKIAKENPEYTAAGIPPFEKPDDPTFEQLTPDARPKSMNQGRISDTLGMPIDSIDDLNVVNNEESNPLIPINFISNSISNVVSDIKSDIKTDYNTSRYNSLERSKEKYKNLIAEAEEKFNTANPADQVKIKNRINSLNNDLIKVENEQDAAKIVLDNATLEASYKLREQGEIKAAEDALKNITSASVLNKKEYDEAAEKAGRDDKPFRPSTAITNQIAEEKRIKDISDQALRNDALEAAGPDDKSFRPTSTTPTPTAEQIAAAEQVYPEDIPKGLLESSKNILKEAWGDLFNPKMLAKAAILYAGARLTGMTGNQALAFAGQAYLNGITTLHKQEQIDDKVKELRATGMYTDASLEIFRLEPKPSNLITKASMNAVKLLGDTKVFHVKQPNGSYKKVIGLKAKFGNENIGYVQKVGKELQPIDQTSPYIETNLSLVPGTDEFFARRKDLDTDFKNFLSDQDGLFSRPDFQEFVENSEGELSTKAQNIFRSQDARSGAMRMRLFAEKYSMPPDAVKEIAIVAAYDAAASKNSGAIKDIFGPNSKFMESAFIKTQIGDVNLFTTYRDLKDPSKTKYDKPENIIAALSAVQNAKDLKGDYVLPDDLRRQSLSRFSQKVLAALLDTGDDDTTDKVTWLDWQASFVQENGVFKPKNGKYIISDKQRAKGITRSLAENINQWHDDVGNKKYAGQSEFIKFLWYKANELEYLASKLN